MSRPVAGISIFVCLLVSTAAFGALTVPDVPQVVEAAGPDGANVFFTILVVGGNDGSDGRPADTVTCSPASGSLFAIGSTTVSCTGSEGSTGSFVVTVRDTTEPLLTIPRDFTVVTSNTSGEPVTYSASATDIVDGSVAISCSPASGSTFPIGANAVTCTASDSRGNTATGGFIISVVTSTPPPGNPDLIAEATGPNGALVNFNTGDSDDADGRPGSGGCSPAPGSLFPLGDTTVTCPSGNFTVSVVDTTPPALDLPSEVFVISSNGTDAAVTFSATASDLVDGSLSASCTPASGATFSLGITTVNCSASDSRGNSASGSFAVAVATEPPPPAERADIVAEATGPNGAVVTFDAGEDDDARPITCSPASGSTFALGETTVSCGDGSSFSIAVIDTTPPALSLPPDQTVEATGPDGATAAFSASATDLVDGAVAPDCQPTSGSTFALGATTVNCSATDAAGNESTGSFAITVVDTTPPTLNLPPDQTIEATGPAGAVATFTATASDLVDGAVTPSCTPVSGSTFALGTTTVNCSATDASGNTANGSFTVTVEDTTPPEIISVTVSPASIWPPNQKLVDVTASAQVNDLVDPAPLVQIYAISCDETIKPADAVVTGALQAKLRADRDAKGNGRIYTLHIEAIDSSGNRSVSTITVVVPHDQGDGDNATSGTPKRKRAVGKG